MGAQPWVAGPTDLFVDDLEIGTAERYPRFLIRSGFSPYFNDITGPVIPMDMLWAGKEAYIFSDINRWDEKSLDSARSLPGPDTSDPLSWALDDVGTLIIHEERSRVITLTFPYASKAKYAGMPKGYQFYAGWMVGPEEFGVLGTNPQKFHCIFHCLPVFTGGRWALGKKL